jgi:hypothetical protein
VSRIGLNPSTNRVQLKGGTRVMAGCCCTDEPCVDDEFTYGVLWPCLGIVYNDCTGAVINPPCLTVRMDRLPSGITAGTVVKIYGLCYTVNAVDLTRCEAISGGCSSGGVATEVALDPAVVIVQAGGVTCLSETCQCAEVGQYPLRCDRTVVEEVKYCPIDGCSIRQCMLFGPGPLVCIEPGQSGVPVPAEDGTKCCTCNTCESWGYLEDSRNPESIEVSCCCGLRPVADPGPGFDPLPCTYTYTSSWEYHVTFDAVPGPAGETWFRETVSCSGSTPAADGTVCMDCTRRTWEEKIGLGLYPTLTVTYDVTDNFQSCWGCQPPRSIGLPGGFINDYLDQTGENVNRGYKGCGGFSDSVVQTTFGFGSTAVTTASESSTIACAPQTICRGSCNNGGRGAAAIDFGEV